MAYNIKKDDTNVELVTTYMEFGSPINQCFVIDALTKQAQLVIENKEELLKQPQSFINMEVWIKSAEDWLECIKKRK